MERGEWTSGDPQARLRAERDESRAKLEQAYRLGFIDGIDFGQAEEFPGVSNHILKFAWNMAKGLLDK